MFKKMTLMFAVGAAGFLLSTSDAIAEMKLGYFDVKRILTELDEAKEAKARLQKDFDTKQKQLDVKREEIEKLQKDFQAKQAVLSQQAKEQQAMELQQKMMEAQKVYVDLQQELAQKEQGALADLLVRLEPVVRDVADKEGYTYVFEKNESGMFYGPSAHDLTPQLIRSYNERFPKGSKPASKTDKKGK